MNHNGKKTLVIGGGPAGAACALWLHQLGCPVLLVEKNQVFGGLQQFSPYENLWFPAVSGRKGNEIAQAIHGQIVERAIPYLKGREVKSIRKDERGFTAIFSDGEGTRCDFIVLATGTRFRSGGFVPTNRLAIGPGTPVEAIEVHGKNVAILGGGDNAFDQYAFIKKRGAKTCNIFARSFRAQKKLQESVPASDVFIGNFRVDQVAMTVDNKIFDIISVQYGFEPVVPDGLNDLARNENGFVLADHWGRTNIDCVFAVGEVAQTFHPCVTTSFAHGIQAAKAIQGILGL